MDTTCSACHRPTDTTLCPGCVGSLVSDLRRVPELAEELGTTIARQAVTGQRVGGQAAEKPLLFHEDASAARTELLRVLAGAVRDIARSGDPHVHAFLPHGVRHEPGSLAEYLWLRPTWIAAHPDAADIADRIHTAIRAGWYQVDRRPDRVYVGSCGSRGCQADIRVNPGRSTTACRECGAVHDVAARLAWAQREISGLTATAAEAERLLRAVGVHCPAPLIRTWAKRGRVAAEGGRYRIADLLALRNPTENAA